MSTSSGDQDLAEVRWAMLTEELAPGWQASKMMEKLAFFAYLKAFPTMAVEMLPVRRIPETDRIDLLMFPRSDDDPFPEYAGRLHTPGCMLMPGMTVKDGLDRVVARETGVDYSVITGVSVPPDLKISPRGYEVPIPFIVRLIGDLPQNSNGRWVAIGELQGLYAEDKLIRAQYESFIARAAHWLEMNKGRV